MFDFKITLKHALLRCDFSMRQMLNNNQHLFLDKKQSTTGSTPLEDIE
ncbi:hypothetical protein CLV24_14215 [Pontibacter ummariensis]|uniref:Uncharacterized protein n=1 Tax=Pontibacter ummariensis TaxID=1610492 RepID=A0A239LHS4_9BACT|nr:hypothetical protein CLV24_14215 [Pontibacter ummariensis]SNT29915.1 hypothetical protein SAMN06296052_14215 [Pontibacter ummariensis]